MLDILNSFDFGSLLTAGFLIVIALLLIRSIRIIPQATAGVVERLGRFHKVLNAGVNLVFPFIDVIRRTVDLREQVVDFQPQSVITEDNLVVSIDTGCRVAVPNMRLAARSQYSGDATHWGAVTRQYKAGSKPVSE